MFSRASASSRRIKAAIGDLASNEAAGLLNLFRENYTAWIRFRDQA
jgi:hypothetical protein